MVEIGIAEQFLERIVVFEEAFGGNGFEFIGKQGFDEHFRAVVARVPLELLDFCVVHEHLENALDDHAVAVGKLPLEPLVHLVDNALQGILFRDLGGILVAGRDQVGILFLQHNGARKRFFQRGILQLDLIQKILIRVLRMRQQTEQIGSEHIFLEQFNVVQPDQLRYECVSLDKFTNCHARVVAVLFGVQFAIPLHDRLHDAADPTERGVVLLFARLRFHNGIVFVNVVAVVEQERQDLGTQIIHLVVIGASFQKGGFVVGLKRVPNVLVGVHKVQNKGAVLAAAGAVEAGKRLNGVDVAQFLIHVHRMEQRLVKPGLIFVCNHQNVEIVAAEGGAEFLIGVQRIAVAVKVQPCFGIVGGVVIQMHRAGKSHQNAAALCLIRVIFQVLFDREIVADGVGAAVGNDHGFPMAADLETTVLKEVGKDHVGFVGNGVTVFAVVADDGFQSRTFDQFGIVLGDLDDPERLFHGDVICQHVKDKTLFNGLIHRVDMERAIFENVPLVVGFPEQFNGLVLGRGGEGEEGLVFVLTLRNDGFHKAVGEVHLVVVHAFFLGVVMDGAFHVDQRAFQRGGALSALPLVGLVHDNGKIAAFQIVKILVGKEEFLNGANDDALAVVDRLGQPAGAFFLVNGFHKTGFVVEGVDRVLQLTVQDHTVGDNDDRIEDRLVFGVVDRCQTVGKPGDGVGLSAAGGMLDQVILPGAARTNVRHDLVHHVELMVARKNQLRLFHRFGAGGGGNFLFFFHVCHIAVEQIEQGVAAEDGFPKIIGGVAVRVGGVALPAGYAGAVGALIEGDKAGGGTLQGGGHVGVVEIDGEIDEETVVEFETEFAGIAVVFELLHRVGNVLPFELVFEFEGDDRDAVDGQDHIDGVMVFEGIGELAGDAENVGTPEFLGGGVEVGFGLEKADADADAHIEDAVAKDGNKTVGRDAIFQAAAELFGGGGTVVFNVLCPLFGLRFHNEIDKDFGIEGFFLVVGVFLDPLTVGVLIGELLVAALGTDQKGLDVLFKALFAGVHHGLLSSVISENPIRL